MSIVLALRNLALAQECCYKFKPQKSKSAHL